MSRLASISSSPTIKAYAQGAAQSAIQPIAEFLAPTVQVATAHGRFKSYTEKNRFRVPKTERGIGGHATQLGFDAEDKYYTCEPHALDYPVDILEKMETAGLENIVKEAADAVVEVGALSHELKVVQLALTTLGAGTDVNVAANGVDLVDKIDEQILNVVKAAKYGSLMGVGIVFGANAFRVFKNHASVRGRFIQGGSKKEIVNPTVDDVMSLFLGKAEARVSMMVYDSAAEGLAENINFVMDNSLIVFARKQNPTRRDPSFMKTFRPMGEWLRPGSYSRDDGRVDVVKYDWLEDVQVTNASAGVRLNWTTT